MSAFNPAAAARSLQLLCRDHKITPHDLAVGMALLWSCRQPGASACMVSFDRLAKLAGVGRTSAVQAVRRLQELGVLARQKTRLRVAWGLGIASRQGRNIYRWIAVATEVAARATNQMLESKKDCQRTGEAPKPVQKRAGDGMLDAALASLAARIGAATRVLSLVRVLFTIRKCPIRR